MKKLISLALALAMTALCIPTFATASGSADNIALGKPIVVSGYYSWDFNHTRINDGNIRTTAATGSVTVDGPREGMETYIGVDLGEKYKLDKIIVRTRRDIKDAWTRIIDGVYVATKSDFTDAVKVGEKKVAGEYESDLEIDLTDSETVGRYVYISSGAYGELEVYGDKYIPVIEGEYEDVNEKYTNAVRTVSKLGIMKGVKNGVFGSSNLVTRGEAAAIANNVLRAQKSVYNGEFADVSANHEYADDIATALSLGIISKAESFRPNDYITTYELFAMLMRIGGFYAYSEDGAWYSDVLNLAALYGLSDKLDMTQTYVSRDNAAMAVFNLLMRTYVKFDANGMGYEMSKNSYIEDKFHMSFGEGVVTANAVTSLTGEKSSSENYIKIGDEDFWADDPAKTKNILGKAVCYLTNDDDELVDVWENTKKTKTVELLSKDIESTSRTVIRVRENGRSVSYRIDNNAYYLKNGVAFSNVKYDELAPKYGSVRLKDFDGDSVYEVVEIRQPDIVSVSSVSTPEDSNELTVSGKDNYKKTFSFDLAYSYTSDGVRSDLSAVKAGKLVYFYQSESEKYLECYVQSGNAEGTVDAIFEDALTIDGEKYPISEYFADKYFGDITIGTEYKFLLNNQGEITGITDTGDFMKGETLVVITKCHADSDAEKLHFKFYTEDNTFGELVAAEKCKADGVKLDLARFNSLGTAYFTGKPAIITVNGNSEIVQITTPESERLAERSENIAGAYISKAGFFRGNADMDLILPTCHDTVSFSIPTDMSGNPKTDEAYQGNYSVTTLEKRYPMQRDAMSGDTVVLYGSDKDNLPIAAITRVQYSDVSGFGRITVYNNANSIIVDKISEVVTNDGDRCYRISGWDIYTGAQKTFTTHSSLTSVINTFKAKNFDLYDKDTVPAEMRPKDDWWRDNKLWYDEKINEYFVEPITSLEKGDIVRYGIAKGRTEANELEVVIKYNMLSRLDKVIPYTAGDLPGTLSSSYRLQKGTISACTDGRVTISLSNGKSENLALSDFDGALIIFDGKYGEKHDLADAELYIGSGETAIIFSSANFHKSILVFK